MTYLLLFCLFRTRFVVCLRFAFVCLLLWPGTSFAIALTVTVTVNLAILLLLAVIIGNQVILAVAAVRGGSCFI